MVEYFEMSQEQFLASLGDEKDGSEDGEYDTDYEGGDDEDEESEEGGDDEESEEKEEEAEDEAGKAKISKEEK